MIGVLKEAASAVKAAGKIELYEKIVDLHSKINDLQSDLQSRTAEVEALRREKAELEAALQFSKKLTFSGVWYFANGDPHPFCPHCWESKKAPIHLRHVGLVMSGERKNCPSCHQTFVDTSKAQISPPRLALRMARYTR
ncbi:MAG: hypothetical protein WBG54_18045 [Acidobacteriaceae bacterium]